MGLLSGGERNRVHLAKMLKEGGNLLLLDEPTNDLDTETLSALEAALEDFAGCAVVISHDRFFLDRMATHILAFEGDSHVEWFEGNFAGLRGGQEAPPRRRRRRAAPHQVQAVRAAVKGYLPYAAEVILTGVSHAHGRRKPGPRQGASRGARRACVRGEDVSIVDPKVGKVKLTPAGSGAARPRKPRRLGLLEGTMKVPARLLEPMTEEEIADWYGDKP